MCRTVLPFWFIYLRATRSNCPSHLQRYVLFSASELWLTIALKTRLQGPTYNVKNLVSDEYGQHTRTDKQKKTDKELAERLCRIIEDAKRVSFI
jgi:hypothetical protein